MVQKMEKNKKVDYSQRGHVKYFASRWSAETLSDLFPGLMETDNNGHLKDYMQDLSGHSLCMDDSCQQENILRYLQDDELFHLRSPDGKAYTHMDQFLSNIKPDFLHIDKQGLPTTVLELKSGYSSNMQEKEHNIMKDGERCTSFEISLRQLERYMLFSRSIGIDFYYAFVTYNLDMEISSIEDRKDFNDNASIDNIRILDSRIVDMIHYDRLDDGKDKDARFSIGSGTLRSLYSDPLPDYVPDNHLTKRETLGGTDLYFTGDERIYSLLKEGS